MLWYLVLVGLLGGDPAVPTDKSVVKKVEFPVVTVPKEEAPAVPDTPSTNPDDPFVLVPGKLFVVSSDVEFELIVFPEDLVTIKYLSGPRDFYGAFADGSGKDEDRSYSKKYLAVVRAVEGKSGVLGMAGVPHGYQTKEEITKTLISIGVAPRPPPLDEEKKPDPKPAPADAFKKSIQDATAKYTFSADEKAKVAVAFRDASKKISSGEIKDLQQLTKVTSDNIVKGIGLNAYIPWYPWRTEITKVLEMSRIQSVADHAKPWSVIADVLEGK